VIEFLTSSDRVVGVVGMRDGELVSDPVLRNVVRAWLRQGKSPESFEEAYASWTNGYAHARHVTDNDTHLDKLNPVIASSLTSAVADSAFHLPGRHDQKRHGNRRNKAEHMKSTSSSKSLNDILDSGEIRDLLDDSAAFDFSSKGAEDRVLAEITRQRGFDAKPELVDTLPSGATPMGRAVTTREYAEQFLTGDYFAGKGQFGNGTYFIQTSDPARLDAVVGIYGDHKVKAGLKPNARVVALADLQDEMKNLVEEAEANEKKVFSSAMEYFQRGDAAGFERDYTRARRRAELLRDPGRAAALLNYDAIVVTPGMPESEVVVLNRGAVLAERGVQ
jgi:hypothetical protein